MEVCLDFPFETYKDECLKYPENKNNKQQQNKIVLWQLYQQGRPQLLIFVWDINLTKVFIGRKRKVIMVGKEATLLGNVILFVG